MGGRVHNDPDQQDQSIRVQSMGFDSWRGMETAHSRPRITALTYSGRMSILELAYKVTVRHWLRSNTLKMGCILPEHMLYTELESCMGCFPGSSDGKASTCNAGDQGSKFLGWNDPLEKEMATHSRTLAWKIPWMEEPGRLQSMGSQRVGHDWATSLYHCIGCFSPQQEKYIGLGAEITNSQMTQPYTSRLYRVTGPSPQRRTRTTTVNPE